ncbi:response regulator transcription factor [Gulosibacter sp. 10]|uniref:response regulator transcription factor n=1 Tax=Gulosibacter sp. 10 TaxID=1255570 RepID=UPI00097E9FDA|nr:response regulator transcription factor [Gulosibacter sp. 10]SJM70760.1 DNA-binding response regulator, LuxR family [Gulosibacter sp. 10]
MGESRSVIRVVVVDDQPLERAGIALILDSDDGIEVVGEAERGELGVELVDRCGPDVVLMDVRMPGMGGIEATRMIVERHAGARVIVLTTFDLDEYAFGGLRAGASAFLLKSIRPEALVEAVKTVASGAAVVAPRVTARLLEHYVRGDEPQPVEGAGFGGRKGYSEEERRALADDREAPEVLEARVAREARRQAVLGSLSPRERDVFEAVVRGSTNAEIAVEFTLAPSTVKSHINSIFAKLHLRDRVHAVILGYELGVAP